MSSVQSPSSIGLFVTPCSAACQASLSITNSQRLLKFKLQCLHLRHFSFDFNVQPGFRITALDIMYMDKHLRKEHVTKEKPLCFQWVSILSIPEYLFSYLLCCTFEQVSLFLKMLLLCEYAYISSNLLVFFKSH